MYKYTINTHVLIVVRKDIKIVDGLMRIKENWGCTFIINLGTNVFSKNCDDLPN